MFYICQISNEDDDDFFLVMFEILSDIFCVMLRKVSFEGDYLDIGYINCGFDNDIYLDNVMF